jgi:ABC-type polysaccharide/polyol phosphate transport system ATPase subunit
VSSDTILRAERLAKRFKIYETSAARLADWLHLPIGPRYREFWALRDISFDLERGECLGIIGPNGAGKTTLLKLLTGVLTPTSGRLETHGRVLSLLELGSDFKPELTGRQNADESLRLLASSTNPERATLLDEIEAFSELGDFFDRPVKMYSSGMFVRLAFSLFSAMEPDIFLVDEALTVGDLRFSGKALARIRRMRERGTTLLFVSHNLDVVKQLCSRVIWVHGGLVQQDGPPADVTSSYIQFMVHGETDVSADPASIAAGTDSVESEPPPVGDGGHVFLGNGWHALEAYAGDVFRWADAMAEIIVEGSAEPRQLRLELEPAAVGSVAVVLCVDTGLGPPTEFVLNGRETIGFTVSDSTAAEQRLRLWLQGDHRPAPGESRTLTFRVFRWGWSNGDLVSIGLANDFRDSANDQDLVYERSAMLAALAHYRPVQNARARFVHVVTRNGEGEEAARFATNDELCIEVRVEAVDTVEKLVVGVEIIDVYGRRLYWTRSDLQTDILPRLASGETTTVTFRCPRLLLGYGVYFIGAGVCGSGLENEIWHLVDRAWGFQVLSAADITLFGVVDLGFQYAPMPQRECVERPEALAHS